MARATLLGKRLLRFKTKLPSTRMFHVIRNIYNYGFIDYEQYNRALEDFDLCSYYIDKYQQDMHKEAAKYSEHANSYNNTTPNGVYITDEDCDTLGYDESMFY